MSILPSQNLASTSSSSSQVASQHHSSDHGFVFLQSQPELSFPTKLRPLDLFESPSPSRRPTISQEQWLRLQMILLDLPKRYYLLTSSMSMNAVNESGRQNGKESLTHPNGGTNSLCEDVGHAGAASAQHRRKSGRTIALPRGQLTAGSTSYKGSTAPPRAPPPRRQLKRKPYNKDLFLQANYKFVVLDSGDYAPELMDPDKMLQWEDIICVKYSTPFAVQCPICLESPLCPQITSCGHILFPMHSAVLSDG
ncbi:unnamed protein product [Ilex paraguariensis]|uniref:Uncharacterized protein n=1 Tax=Ilex paraguariensis TaxID=185542 RepID=A0ABC8UXS8_9AQUA